MAANHRFRQLSGFSAEELIGSALDDRVVSLAGRAEWGRRDAVGSKPLVAGPCRIVCRDGQVRQATVELQKLSDGRTLAWIRGAVPLPRAAEAGVVEQALRGSEARYREVFENALEGMFQTTPEGRFVSANPALARILGYASVDDLIQSVQDIGVQVYANPEVRRRQIEGTLVDGRPRTAEVELRRKDGSPVWVLLHHWAATTGRDGPPRIAGFVVDITERKRAESELRHNEQEYRALSQQFRGILNAVPDAMCLISRDLRLIWANDVAATNMGMTLPEFLGKHCYESRHGRKERCERCLVLESFDSGTPLTGEGRTPDGRVWELSALPILADDGSVTSVIEAARDITDRKLAEDDRLRLQAQLAQAQKMESVGRLAGGVAHDFNNMLMVILGQAELALAGLEPDRPPFAELQAIRTAAGRSAELTRQLLAFARKQTVAPQVVDINAVIERTLTMLRRLIGEDVSLCWLPGQDLWPVKVDPTQLDQILANLCVNARDAIGEIGTITIETSNVAVDNEVCAGHAGFVPGDFVMLAVSDDGCGMDADTQARLFEPFFTTKELGKGTGLGLATIYGIVKQNHGFINVYSEAGQGSAFRVYLPRHAGATDPATPATALRSQIQGNGTILVVEDEPTILILVRTMLERRGFTVLAASTPEEALRLGAGHDSELDLLLTDVIMPGMNGRELAHRLVAFHPNLKTLFMSGYSADVIAHHGVLEARVHFIAKPFSSVDLTAKIEAVLQDRL